MLDESSAELVRQLVPDTSEIDPVWRRENIESINEAVQDGLHETAYYPACGRDILRVVGSYDLAHLVAVDSYDFEGFQEQLDQLGIVPTLTDLPNSSGTEYIFELGGKERKVTLVVGDAREISLADFGLNKVDVWHVYLPTGADEDITEQEVYLRGLYGDRWYSKLFDAEARQAMDDDPNAPEPDDETGHYKIVSRKIDKNLTASNICNVNVGGFLVLNERSWQAIEESSVLDEIAGLKKIPITTRHPFDVLTSLYPTPEELNEIDRRGCIYQKTKEVSPEVIGTLEEVRELSYWSYYWLDMFESGNHEYIDTKGNSGEVDIEFHLKQKLDEFDEVNEEITKSLRNQAVEEELIAKLINQRNSILRDKISNIKMGLEESLLAIKQVSDDLKKGDITEDQAFEFLEIEFKNELYSGGLKAVSKKYLWADKLCLGDAEHVAYFREAARQFVAFDLPNNL